MNSDVRKCIGQVLGIALLVLNTAIVLTSVADYHRQTNVERDGVVLVTVTGVPILMVLTLLGVEMIKPKTQPSWGLLSFVVLIALPWSFVGVLYVWTFLAT